MKAIMVLISNKIKVKVSCTLMPIFPVSNWAMVMNLSLLKRVSQPLERL